MSDLDLSFALSSSSPHKVVDTGLYFMDTLFFSGIPTAAWRAIAYLSCLTTSRSLTDKLAFDVGLQEDASGEACWWTIHPASKQRSEGEKVRVGDDLILVSVSSERYLHLSTASGELQADASFMQTLWNMNPISSGCEEGKGSRCVAEVTELTLGFALMVNYEGGAVCSQARSLWRLEPLRISWSGSHMKWGQPFRVRHVTTGRYLALTEEKELVVVDAEKANTKVTSFCFRGMITLVLNCIDRLNEYSTAAHFAEFAGEDAAESWKEIVNLLYELLASLIRGNRSNCAPFFQQPGLAGQQTGPTGGVLCMRPNIFLGTHEGSTQYKKWYYELIVDSVEPFVTAQATHLRVGWAMAEGYSPYPGGGEGWGGNGVGDDLYSFGFDGLQLWSGRVARAVASPGQHMLGADDVVSCCLDLSVPSISFRINGFPVQGIVRFLLGGRHGEFKFLPPPGYAPCYEGVLPREKMRVEPIKEYKHDINGFRNLLGPTQSLSHTSFTPYPVDTIQIVLPPHLEKIRERLAENIHELWALTRIEQGWIYGPVRDDNKHLHPCLLDFHSLPEPERNYNLQMSGETLKTLLALGCHVGMADEKAEENLKKTKLPKTYMMSNGYKPAPLDLNHIKLTPAQNTLVDKLAENGHNDIRNKRNPRLVPYHLLDERTKKTNRDSLREAVRTLLGYGYNIEPPDQETPQELTKGRLEKVRIFRAEQFYAVKSGKWYFEFEAVTTGEMRVGWARPNVRPDVELGADDLSYVFNGHRGQRWHIGSEPFGRPWQPGDVVGCLIDLIDNHIMFTLNGEMLISDSGFIPVCSLGLSQVGRLNLGQDVSSLRYFTICGLQEGYEPFAINTKREVTMWFSKSLPQFSPVLAEHPHYEISRIDGTVDNPPCLKLTHRTFGSQNAIVELLFLRLSMPVEFHEKFKVLAGTTPLTHGLTIPEDEVKDVDLDSEFEQLKKTASRKEAEEAEKEKQGPGSPATHKELPKEAPKAENEKDSSNEKSKAKRGFLFKAKKATTLITPAPVVPTVPRLEEEVVPDDRDDPEIIMNTTTYYYSVRIFAGQEPTTVWVGWVTPDYHQHDMNFDLTKVRNVTVTMGDDKGNIHDSTTQQTRVSMVDLVIGCLIDLATGFMTFTANGKEVNTFFQVEPNTKLFPAVVVLPTNQNVIQFELGKLKNIMPISAAMFRSERKNTEPQCPPRLTIQMLAPMTWSRMPNEFLRVDVARFSDRHGWMVECLEPNIMMALHIPEENRCIDILELSERQDLLTFHSHSLKLYCAVCALGNNRVAHALCSHVDESQLLYTIESNHLPGLLRAGYYDLLISMHLESAKRSRLMMNSEFIVPMTDETKSITLFPDGMKKPGLPGVGMSTCLRPPLHFSDTCFVSTTSELYQLSPSIPLDALKVKAINMLTEAVQDGGQHTRDPVGGSVEFQFVPVLKLVCTLLIMGVFEDEDVRHILK
ncbi:hypothetical protein Chor_001926, partial [Crotalus horridus]